MKVHNQAWNSIITRRNFLNFRLHCTIYEFNITKIEPKNYEYYSIDNKIKVSGAKSITANKEESERDIKKKLKINKKSPLEASDFVGSEARFFFFLSFLICVCQRCALVLTSRIETPNLTVVSSQLLSAFFFFFRESPLGYARWA